MGSTKIHKLDKIKTQIKQKHKKFRKKSTIRQYKKVYEKIHIPLLLYHLILYKEANSAMEIPCLCLFSTFPSTS